MEILYTAGAKSKGGRNGHTETSDGLLKLDLAVPKEMGGPGKQGTNPEQLFACAYSACFGGAIEHVAKQQKKNLKEIEITAHVGVGPRAKGGFGLDVNLKIHLPGVPKDEAEALVKEAHQICPYSNATRGNIDVRLEII